MTTVTLYNPTNNNLSESFNVSKLNPTLDSRILSRVDIDWLPMKVNEYNIADYSQQIQAWVNIKQVFLNYFINKYNLTGFNATPNMVLQKLTQTEQQLINKIDSIIQNIYIQNGVLYNGGRIRSKKGKSIKKKSRRLRMKSRRLRRR
jgi:hypothetical protein